MSGDGRTPDRGKEKPGLGRNMLEGRLSRKPDFSGREGKEEPAGRVGVRSAHARLTEGGASSMHREPP